MPPHSELPPVARTTAVETSHVGEREITRSGARAGQVAACAEYVTANPGLCRGEVAAGLGLTEYQASKRLSDAKNLGLIHMAGDVRWKSRLQSRWWPGAEPAKARRRRVLEGCSIHGQDRETVRARWDAASTAKVPEGKVILCCECCDAPALGVRRPAYDEAGNELPGGVSDPVTCSKCVEAVA